MLDKGIHIAYSPKHNGVVELKSLNFPKRAQFHVTSVPDEKLGDWADHMRGAAKMQAEKYPLRMGLSAVIEGTLPVGGLSSSVAVIIAFLSAPAKVNNIALGDWETIMMAKAAENKYVGVNCGKLDQFWLLLYHVLCGVRTGKTVADGHHTREQGEHDNLL